MKVPENKCRHGILLSPACTVAGVILVLSSYSSCSKAAEWKVLPRLNLIETYSDNLRLSPGGQGDFVTQINPGILLNGTGRRFILSADYTMNNLIYAENSSLTRMRQQLNARGTAELMKIFFSWMEPPILLSRTSHCSGPKRSIMLMSQATGPMSGHLMSVPISATVSRILLQLNCATLIT